MKINKKAQVTIGFVLAIFLAIILLIFLFGGGFTTIYNVTHAISQVPIWFWLILGLLFLIKLLKGKK